MTQTTLDRPLPIAWGSLTPAPPETTPAPVIGHRGRPVFTPKTDYSVGATIQLGEHTAQVWSAAPAMYVGQRNRRGDRHGWAVIPGPDRNQFAHFTWTETQGVTAWRYANTH